MKSHLLKIIGLSEREVNEKLESPDLIRGLKSDNSFTMVISGDDETGIEIRITAKDEDEERAKRLIEKAEDKLRERLGDHIFGMDEETLEKVVGALLTMRKKTLAIAESCTGGLISHHLTNVPGSSSYFHSSVVAYSDEAKTAILQVPLRTLKRFGAVSPETSQAMAEGIKKLSGADLGLAVTGIAGPGGGTAEKPVGLVYIALAANNDVSTEEHRFSGERETIKLKTSRVALDMVRRCLLKE